MKEKQAQISSTLGVLASGIVLWGWALCWGQAVLLSTGKPAFVQRCHSQSDHKRSNLQMWYKGEKSVQINGENIEGFVVERK